MAAGYKYIYGPVFSWRLGTSLGVDLISSRRKICTFDCLYCQLGQAGLFTGKREEFVSVEKVVREIDSLPPLKIDYITFSGTGEPTLAKNLGEVIKALRKVRNEKIAVLTNSSLIDRRDVQRDLLLADFVLAKLDVPSQRLFEEINRPMPRARLERIVEGLKEFKRRYKGRLALQIMFVRENKGWIKDIAQIAREIDPDEVQINTPLRSCGVRPLPKKDIGRIKGYFKGMKVVSVYDSKREKVKPIDRKGVLIRRSRAKKS